MKVMPLWLKRTLIVIACIVMFTVILAVAFFAIVYSQADRIGKVNENTLEWTPPEEEVFETDPETEYTDDEYSDDEHTDDEDTDEEDTERESETTAPPVVDPDDVVIDKIDPIVSDGLINVLLVGQDKRGDEGRQRSDTMILLSINPKTNAVSMISFLRDMYVSIAGGYSPNRLNVAYLYGGFACLDRTLSENFGVNVDYNIEVDFTAFVKIVDRIGGIDMELTKREANYMNKHMDCDVKKGMNHLDGEEALSYCRIRKIDSDFGRTDRQRKTLLAILDVVKTKSIDEILALVNELIPYLTTDMTNMEILTLTAQFIPVLADFDINTYYVPADGTYYAATIRKMQVLVPDTAKIRELLIEEYLPFSRD